MNTSPENKNKSIEDLLDKFDDLWFRKGIGQQVSRKETFKMLTDLRDAGQDERLLSVEARSFGWTLDQLDNPFLRAWLCDD